MTAAALEAIPPSREKEGLGKGGCTCWESIPGKEVRIEKM